MSEDKKLVVERMRVELQKQLRAERRERIATAVLQGLLSNHRREGSISEAAEISVRYADALIAELDKGAAAEIEQLRADNERLRKALIADAEGGR